MQGHGYGSEEATTLHELQPFGKFSRYQYKFCPKIPNLRLKITKSAFWWYLETKC